MISTRSIALAATLGLLLGGCSSNGAGSPNPQTPSSGGATVPEQGTPASMTANIGSDAGRKNNNTNAVDAVNALGSATKTYEDENANEGGGKGSKSIRDDAMADGHYGNGTCHDGREFFVPDRAGNADSTETLYFYEAACTQLARDVVRIWSPGSSAGTETVNRTASTYAQGDATTPISVRTSVANFSNATFTKNGFPVVADGFVLETQNQLTIGTAKNVTSDSEMVMESSSTNVNNYCSDSAGFNQIPIPTLDKEFGWNGGAFTANNTRTANSNGSVTWSATHTGETESGPVGGLSVDKGATNSACPIVTPAYTLAGGTVRGTYTIPITVTFLNGWISNLTVTNATLSSGDTLNVTTNSSVSPTNSNFITGTVNNGSATVATFDVNTFGDGTLTSTKTGNQFVITDWNVVR